MTTVATADTLLDLRGLSSEERTSRGLAAFDSLVAEERLVLLVGDAAGDILRQLQEERRGLFEWSVLAAGPPAWRIELTRRAGTLGAPRGIDEALSWDHDRLDALEAAAFLKREQGDLKSASDLYAAFAAGLRRHIGFEEQILFPAFEGASGMTPAVGPTAVMRAEHREIESLLGQIEAGIGDGASPAEELRRRFHAVLGEHNVKEEEILYPMSDGFLGEQEADRLVEQIQRFGG
jgi:regulator of cell morphogenesis and NO signaling